MGQAKRLYLRYLEIYKGEERHFESDLCLRPISLPSKRLVKALEKNNNAKDELPFFYISKRGS